MKKNLKVLAVFVVLSAVLFASCKSSKISGKKTPLISNSEIQSGKLENGMGYYILKNGEPKNRISLRLVVKAGACMQDSDQSGVAHFVEHMCFNGTEHFEKNTLIDYAELIGMAFGPEVNAYTSFEETVYMLEIPADKPEYLKQALLIFHDWASAVTFDPIELDKERGVIVEEWRGSRGLNGRLSDSVIPFELKDSGYVDHLPIGDMNVIKNISRDRVYDFYKKWYRPELMSVVVAGDCDPQVVKAEIQNAMENIPKSENPIEAPVFAVPLRTEKDVLLFKDPEMPYITARFITQDAAFKPTVTEEDFLKNIAIQIITHAGNSRLSEIIKSADSPWLAANLDYFCETNSTAFSGIAFVPKDGMFVQAMERVFDEYDRLNLYGITETELQRGKDTVLTGEKQAYERRNGISSSDRVSSICNQVITGQVSLSDDDILRLTEQSLNAITLEKINQLIKELFADRGNMAIILAPENAAVPSEKEILDSWNNYQNKELAAYEDEVTDGEIMERPAKKAEIISENDIKKLQTKEYVLENGVKILIKRTDFDKDYVGLKVVSKGGYSMVSDQEYPSLFYSPMYTINSGIGNMSISQLQKFLSDKNINLYLDITNTEECMSASSNHKDVEVILQIVNQIMTNPKFTDDAWAYIYSNAQTISKSYNVQPGDAYNNRINEILYGKSLKYSGLNEQFVAALDKELSQKLFRERFSNAADFTFIFTGDIDENKLIDLCCYYLGTIPSNSNEKEVVNEKPYNFPAGTKEIVKKGTDNQGAVFIAFGGKLPSVKNADEAWKDDEMLEQLRALVDIRLREIIREDKSGTYGVSTNAYIGGSAERYYEFQVRFGCEPEREEELTAEVISALEDIKVNGVSQIYIDKVNETWRRSFEVNRRENWWTSNMLELIDVWNRRTLESFSDDKSVINWTTSEEIKNLANKYLDTEKYVSVYLQPNL